MLLDGTGVSVGAGATTNVALGRPIEFLGVASVVLLYAIADAALFTIQVLSNLGGQQLAPIASGVPVNTAAAAGQGPKIDEDVIAQFPIPAGARTQINVTNGGGAAANFRWRAQISP